MKLGIFFFLIILLFLLLKNINEKLTNKNNENIDKPDFKIVMFLTGGIKREAENCIYTLKKINLDKKLQVTALDKEAYEHIKKLNVDTVLKEANVAKEGEFHSHDFYKITYNKLEIIEKALKDFKKIVVYTDSDIVFLKDIHDDVQKFKESKADILIQDDSNNFNNTKNYCTGFIFLKPNKTCLEILRGAKKIMKDNWENREWDTGGGADQKAIHESISNMTENGKKINLEILDLKEFPNGARYFKNTETIYKDYIPKIIHNNHIKGNKNKEKRFKEYNFWYVN